MHYFSEKEYFYFPAAIPAGAWAGQRAGGIIPQMETAGLDRGNPGGCIIGADHIRKIPAGVARQDLPL
jgi:hypothetical protein